MGELSKKTGEQGEKIVSNFLSAIGWGNTIDNIDLPCLCEIKHQKDSSQKPRTTHGIDAIFRYETPLFENILEHVIISVKFSDKKYKANPNSDFKSHFTDLATALECYEKSELQNEYSDGFTASNNATKGLLIWIHNQGEDDSIVDKLSVNLDKSLVYDTIYVLDNARIAFIHKCIKFIKYEYTDFKSSFYYTDTGHNPSTISKKYDGDILPLQYIFSDIQIFKLEEDKTQKITFVLISKDIFEENSLKRLIGLAHNLTKNLTANVDICFPDYDKLHHSNSVTKIKGQFTNNNFTNKIRVVSYNNRFQNAGK